MISGNVAEDFSVRYLTLLIALPLVFALASCRSTSAIDEPLPDEQEWNVKLLVNGTTIVISEIETPEEKAWRKQREVVRKQERKRLEKIGTLTPEEERDAKRLHVLAEHAWEKEDYMLALRHYAVLSARYGESYEPAGAQAHLAIGDCYMKMKEYKKAAFSYKTAITGYPRGTRKFLAYIQLGDAYMAAERYDRAFRAYYLAKIIYRERAVRKNIQAKIDGARDAYIKQLQGAGEKDG